MDLKGLSDEQLQALKDQAVARLPGPNSASSTLQGLSDDELEALKQRVSAPKASLTTQPSLPSVQRSSGGPSMFFKGMLSTAPRMASQFARGLTAYVPEGRTDSLLSRIVDRLGTKVRPDWEQEAAQAASEGPLWGSGAGQTYQALLGMHVPLLASMATMNVGGKALGAWAGLQATGTPHGAAVGGSVGGALAGVAGIGLVETGQFMDEAKQLGLDQDLIEKYSRVIGPINGGIEQLQYVFQVRPLQALGAGRVGKKVAGEVVEASLRDAAGPIQRILSRVAKETGINLSEGAEEWTQGGVSNWLMKKAMDEQRQRNPNWQPTVPYQPQDLGRSFATGTILSAVTRGAAHTVVKPYLIAKEMKANRVDLDARSEELYQQIKKESGEKERAPSKTKVIPTERPELDVAPLHFREKLRMQAKKWEPSVMRGAVSRLGITPLRQLASRIGVAVKKAMTPTFFDPFDDPNFSFKGRSMTAMAYALGHAATESDTLRLTLEQRQQATQAQLKQMMANPEAQPVAEMQQAASHMQYLNEAMHVVNEKKAPGSTGHVIPTKTELAKTHPKDVKLVQQALNLNKQTWLTKEELMSSVLEDLGAIEEGPRIKGGEVVLTEPVLDPVGQEDLDHADRVEKQLVVLSNNLAEHETKDVEAQKTRAVGIRRQIRASALHEAFRDTGTPVPLSLDNTLNPQTSTVKEEAAARKARGQYMSSRQFAAYLLAMEHEVNSVIRSLVGLEAAAKPIAAFNAAIYSEATVGPITDSDGNVLNVRTMKNLPQISAALHRFRPFVFLLKQIQDATGLRLINLDNTLITRHHGYVQGITNVSHAMRNIFRKVPKPLTRGGRRRLFKETVFLMMVSREERAWALKQLGLSEKTTDLELAQRVIDGEKSWRESKKPSQFTAQETLNYLEAATVDFKQFFDWFFRQGGMSWSLYRQHYLPLVREYIAAGGGNPGSVSWPEHLQAKKASGYKARELSEMDWDSMANLGDTIHGYKQRGFRIMENIPFYEHVRKADIAHLKEVGAKRDLDIENLMDIYMRKMLRKFYFDDVVPSVAGALHTFETEAIRVGMKPDVIKEIVDNYIASVVGIPDATASNLADINIRSDTHIFGKMLNKTMDWWNGNFGHVKEWQDFYSPGDAISAATTVAYSWFLGLPLNYISPIKNLSTQNVMAGILGMKTYLKGMASLRDPAIRKELEELSPLLRPEYPLAHSERFVGRGTVGKFAQSMLYIYWMSDQINIMSTAAGALVAWKRLAPEFEKSPTLKGMTFDQFVSIVFQGQDPKALGLNTDSVLEKPLTLYEKDNFTEMSPTENVLSIFPWRKRKGGPRAMRGLAEEMWERIGNGKSEEAKRLFAQYMVNLTQWRYGAGGSPQFLGNPLVRMMFMFATWPINSIEYTGMLADPKNGMLREGTQVLVSQMLIAAVLTVMGFKAFDWIGTGPLPEEFGFMGPWADFISELLGVLKGTGRVGMTELLPAEEEERKKAIDSLNRQWEDLME